jgi:hypothetical protein
MSRGFINRRSASVLGAGGLLLFAVTACSQNPSFKEDSYVDPAAIGNSSDQTGVATGGVGTEEEMDPGVIAQIESASGEVSGGGLIPGSEGGLGAGVGETSDGGSNSGDGSGVGDASSGGSTGGSTGGAGSEPTPVATPTPLPTYDPGEEPTLQPQHWSQEFTQQGPGKVDILWVVDNSGSMAEEQAYLGQNFQAFINQLSTFNADFQIAVTNTDVCDDTIPSDLSLRKCPASYGGSAATHLRGSFVGDSGRKVLKRGESDLLTRFASYTALGTNGSGFEHGLNAAQMAVQKVVAGQNESLLRSDAFLAVIVVSDEEDDGIGLGMTDAYSGYNFFTKGLTTYRYTDDDLISYLSGVKGAGKFGVSTITGTRLANGSMCSAPHSQPLEEGTQYLSAARKTGGISQSICDTNWNNSLAQMGLDLGAQISQVVFEKEPLADSIVVKVNGVVSTAWEYLPATRALRFNAGSLPPPGAQVRIDYETMM